MAQGRNK